MKKKLCMLFAIVLLLVGGCNEKSQNYFTGIILKITDNYFIVSPDDSESIRAVSYTHLDVYKRQVSYLRG